MCGSWQVRQSRTAGGCTVPLMSAAFLSAWQVMQSATGVAVISLTRVTSLLTRISWQLRQPVASRNEPICLCPCLVAFEALRGVGILVQRNRMYRRHRLHRKQHQTNANQAAQARRSCAPAGDHSAEPCANEGTNISIEFFTKTSCTNIAVSRDDACTFQTAPNVLRISKFACSITNRNETYDCDLKHTMGVLPHPPPPNPPFSGVLAH